MRIIPAIDIIDGKCVRLTRGDYKTKKVYYTKPLEVAKMFEDAGIKYLHLVDLDGAKAKHIVNHQVLLDICSKTKLKVDFGGGLKTNEDLKIAFQSGANQITGGSIAVTNPSLFLEWISQYGSNKIILGADCINRQIATTGWLQKSNLDIIDFIKTYQTKGVTNVICTDIDRDGMLQGPSIKLYQEIRQKTSINIIASGGVSKLEDLLELSKIGCNGAIVGKAIYEGNISLKELQSLC